MGLSLAVGVVPGYAIFCTETIRGPDIFNLLPSEHLGENEIVAAVLADQGGEFSPQQRRAVAVRSPGAGVR